MANLFIGRRVRVAEYVQSLWAGKTGIIRDIVPSEAEGTEGENLYMVEYDEANPSSASNMEGHFAEWLKPLQEN